MSWISIACQLGLLATARAQATSNSTLDAVSIQTSSASSPTPLPSPSGGIIVYGNTVYTTVIGTTVSFQSVTSVLSPVSNSPTRTFITAVPTSMAVFATVTKRIPISTQVPDPTPTPLLPGTIATNGKPILNLDTHIDPAFALLAAWLILTGLPILLLGPRHRWIGHFVAGWYLVALVILVCVLRFGIQNQVVAPGVGLRVGFFFICSGISLLGAVISAVYRQATQSFTVAPLASFLFALYLQSVRSDGLLRDDSAKWVFMLATTVTWFSLGCVPRFQNAVQTISFAWLGAIAFIVGIDCVTCMGYKEMLIWNLGFKIFPSLALHFPMVVGIAIEVAAIPFVAVVGIVVQVRYATFLKLRHEAEISEELTRETDHERWSASDGSSRRPSGVLPYDRKEWEKRYPASMHSTQSTLACKYAPASTDGCAEAKRPPARKALIVAPDFDSLPKKRMSNYNWLSTLLPHGGRDPRDVVVARITKKRGSLPRYVSDRPGPTEAFMPAPECSPPSTSEPDDRRRSCIFSTDPAARTSAIISEGQRAVLEERERTKAEIQLLRKSINDLSEAITPPKGARPRSFSSPQSLSRKRSPPAVPAIDPNYASLYRAPAGLQHKAQRESIATRPASPSSSVASSRHNLPKAGSASLPAEKMLLSELSAGQDRRQRAANKRMSYVSSDGAPPPLVKFDAPSDPFAGNHRQRLSFVATSAPLSAKIAGRAPDPWTGRPLEELLEHSRSDTADDPVKHDLMSRHRQSLAKMQRPVSLVLSSDSQPSSPERPRASRGQLIREALDAKRKEDSRSLRSFKLRSGSINQGAEETLRSSVTSDKRVAATSTNERTSTIQQPGAIQITRPASPPGKRGSLLADAFDMERLRFVNQASSR
ncbi:hypothetical protein E5Q_00793 [Mixia osmundae IAM 14324]|uniref:TM7S3/TM198-like domain-containing protein n=2 Tax=Mixia osmundae (strain CBS 9802 / IAM 14324 / JCM 22182 / KY 12970) TaxID=764103 RepID=G7DU85_MIXOS|nr:hypothetical protein E5Q_00793 [Mixia osmundae IAM 14324]